jgi:hypothetical protein
MAILLPRPFGLGWYNRPFRPVESFSPSFLAWIMSAMCGIEPTWKRRVVNTLFFPFDPVLRHLGACPRGAMIGSYGPCVRGRSLAATAGLVPEGR